MLMRCLAKKSIQAREIARVTSPLSLRMTMTSMFDQARLSSSTRALGWQISGTRWTGGKIHLESLGILSSVRIRTRHNIRHQCSFRWVEIYNFQFSFFALWSRLGNISSDYCSKLSFDSSSNMACHRPFKSAPASSSLTCLTSASGSGPKAENSLNKITGSGTILSVLKSG